MKNQTCVVIGASHGGVTLAFALRKEGWEGKIVLFDKDPVLPYHRPPLSKSFLTDEQDLDSYAIKSIVSYEEENIDLKLGVTIVKIDSNKKTVLSDKNETILYDILVFATGCRAFVPAIKGIDKAKNVFTLRTAHDALSIKKIASQKNIVIIGGGYIGLEMAASLKKIGANITVLEREERILCRVTAPEISSFFYNLHHNQGVKIYSKADVVSVEFKNDINVIQCADGQIFEADIIIVGVGVKVNLELAEAIGLEINNGIVVNTQCLSSHPDIFAIGDCSKHSNIFYETQVRLESVQNALDQAKVAAAAICGQNVIYDSIPWFWSDQYDVKLQIVGLSAGYDEVIFRQEPDTNKYSAWYFKGEKLLSVDAINHAKAYVFGTKLLKEKAIVNKTNLLNQDLPFTIENFKTV